MYIVRQLVVSLPQWKLLPWNLHSIVSSPRSGVCEAGEDRIGRIYGLRRWVHLPNIPIIYQKVLSQKQIVYLWN